MLSPLDGCSVGVIAAIIRHDRHDRDLRTYGRLDSERAAGPKV